jgi:RNA polymerase sigma factor (sigma-70 family)
VSEPTDDELMVQVRDGDPEPLAVLFERYQVPLYNFFLRQSGQASTSEDLVQEVFLRVLKYKHTFKGQGQFRSWLYQIARSARADHYRKRGRETELTEEAQEMLVSPDTGASELLAGEQRAALVRAALLRLPEAKREVLVMSRFQNLRYTEIARALGVAEGTVKVRVHRAMKELREQFLQLTRERVA